MTWHKLSIRRAPSNCRSRWIYWASLSLWQPDLVTALTSRNNSVFSPDTEATQLCLLLFSPFLLLFSCSAGALTLINWVNLWNPSSQGFLGCLDQRHNLVLSDRTSEHQNPGFTPWKCPSSQEGSDIIIIITTVGSADSAGKKRQRGG